MSTGTERGGADERGDMQLGNDSSIRCNVYIIGNDRDGEGGAGGADEGGDEGPVVHEEGAVVALARDALPAGCNTVKL